MKIIDDEEYEKNKCFMIVLEEPILLEVGQRHGELRTQTTDCSLSASKSAHCTASTLRLMFYLNYPVQKQFVSIERNYSGPTRRD